MPVEMLMIIKKPRQFLVVLIFWIRMMNESKWSVSAMNRNMFMEKLS
jgi:hypothetical protein